MTSCLFWLTPAAQHVAGVQPYLGKQVSILSTSKQNMGRWIIPRWRMRISSTTPA